MDPISLGLLFGSSILSIANAQLDREDAKSMHEAEMDFNAKQAELNRQFQRSEREAVQQFNIDMWNANNDYNDISSQLQRAKDAGVSPSTLLGGKYQSYSPSAVISNPMSGSQASYASSLAASLLNASATNKSLTSGALESLSKSALNKQEFDWNKATFEDRCKEVKTNLERNEASIKDLLASAGLKDAEKETVLKSAEYIAEWNTAQIDEKKQSFVNLRAQYDVILAQAKNLEKEGREIESRIDVNEKTLDRIDQDISKSEEEEKYIEEVSSGKKIDNALNQMRLDFSKESGIMLGTSEFEFMFQLEKSGKLNEFIDKVTVPVERSKWKPFDWKAPAGTYARDYEWKTGKFNPKWKSSEAEYNLIDRKTTSESFRNFKP